MTIVSHDKWRDAIKFLMNLGTGPNLTTKDQHLLRSLLRGPFAEGMNEDNAKASLIGLGWRKS